MAHWLRVYNSHSVQLQVYGPAAALTTRDDDERRTAAGLVVAWEDDSESRGKKIWPQAARATLWSWLISASATRQATKSLRWSVDDHLAELEEGCDLYAFWLLPGAIERLAHPMRFGRSLGFWAGRNMIVGAEESAILALIPASLRALGFSQSQI
ncbi:conserved hypothetical protein [Coccidioides posadasii str. Silveira]|uniref:Uncharacterized protein n=1 Tax=Coccidioides posadasii (strain RMSCC 757 / Silveira) TaxID=443226 RepID=E9D8U0_COCPS|nr:conserved hypothetical protein [Coccidioides posadasii str. Silveira]